MGVLSGLTPGLALSQSQEARMFHRTREKEDAASSPVKQEVEASSDYALIGLAFRVHRHGALSDTLPGSSPFRHSRKTVSHDGPEQFQHQNSSAIDMQPSIGFIVMPKRMNLVPT